MLPSHHVIFTAIEGTLLDPASHRWSAAEEALVEIERRHVPLVLVSGRTRAQLEPLRAKIAHSHPFITENGGGLFIPDGYFSMRLEGAIRIGRYFCVRFAKDYAAATTALEEIAAETEANVVGFSQMSPREIAGNTGDSLREAELAHQRDFSERFFFVGDADKAAERFVEAAKKRGWQAGPADPKQPFWELSSINGPARAIRHLMGLYRTSLHRRLRSFGIGSAAEHLSLLAAVEHPIILPRHGQEFDSALVSGVANATKGATAGPAGWNEAVLELIAT
jgi:mannosyl-3-phosphoglycerate phosphatase family protein